MGKAALGGSPSPISKPASKSASAEVSYCPADATCGVLTSIALKIAASGDDSADFQSELSELAKTDIALGQLLEDSGLQLDADSQSSNSPDPGLKLLQILCGLSLGENASCSQLNLVQTAHLCLRAKHLEDRFEESLKNKNLSQLYNFAYGLSHELNNPLANISTRASVLATQEQNASKRDLLDSIVENAMRGRELLGDLMLIARPPIYELKPLNTNELLNTLVEQSKKWCAQFSIELEYEPKPAPQILADQSAIQEALWAVIRNAIEALPAGGRIQLSTNHVDEHLHIEISDNGNGLSPDALKHAFDPFFSGREAGRGLGIGLAKCQAIIRHHQGTMEIANGALGGCIVKIQIPSAG